MDRPELLFHEDYEGPRFTYGLKYRPLQIGAQPKGYIIGTLVEDDMEFRFGTIQYPRKLTEDELKSYEMEFVPHVETHRNQNK